MVPRPTNAPRAFAPREIRSAQGSAATGRHETVPGAIKLYSDPYTYNDSSPLPDPEPVQQRPTQAVDAVDQAVDQGGNYVPSNEVREAMLSPEAQRKAIDTIKDFAGNRATNAATQGGIVGTAVGAAGYGTNAAINAGLTTGANALVDFSSMTNPVGLTIMGVPLADTWAPRGWAALERTMAFNDIEDDYSGVTATSKRGLSTPLGMPEDQVAAVSEDYYNAMQDYYNHSRPLHEQIADTTVGRAVTGFVDDYVIDPFKRHVAYPTLEAVGLRESDDERAQQRARAELNALVDDMMKDQVAPADVEGIDETALDAYGPTPDFAVSGFDYNPMQSQAQNMEAMKTQERVTEEKKQEEKARAAAPQTKDPKRPNSYEPSGIGAKGHMSTGGAGGLRSAEAASRSSSYSSNSNPGGFSKASGGIAGGGFGGGMSNGRGRN